MARRGAGIGGEAGLTPKLLKKMNPTPNTGALHGIRVLDLSRILGGPLCGQILGDHGADVLKVEPPQGDDTRHWGPPFQADGVASYYLGLNRNKRLQFLDLSTQGGQQAVLALMERADVVIENFKIGTLEKWGIGWQQMQSRWPHLIWCRVSGFGADGPLGAQPGYDAAIQATAGLMSVNGESDQAGGAALRLGVPVVDMVTGLNAVIGVLLALHERKRSGQGQLVDAALYDSALALLHPHAANWFLNGQTPQRMGNAHPNIYPYDNLPTSDGPIFLAVGNDRQFALLCQYLQHPEWTEDTRFATAGERSRHRDALRPLLEVALQAHRAQPLAEALMRLGVPAAAVLDVPAALQHPHTEHREMVVQMQGDYRGLGAPVKLSRTPASYRHAPLTQGDAWL